MNLLVWNALRIWVRGRCGRWPPPMLSDPICYFAYGSNMNERLFRERRHMVWREVRIGRLDGHRLAFTIAGGMRPGVSAPANIVAAGGESVWGVLYLLPLRKFACLDASEGRQYDYLWTDVEDATGNRLRVVTYKVPGAAPEGRPGKGYLNLIREAARRRGLPPAYIAFLDHVEARE
jgi:cation transport regulator ChaC